MRIGKKVEQQIESVEFKVKRRWWSWALFIIIHVFVIIPSAIWGAYFLFAVVFIIDMVVVFPAASHLVYIMDDKFLYTKRLIYPDIEIPISAITQVDEYHLTGVQGFGLARIEFHPDGYRIICTLRRGKRYIEIVTPKDRQKFITELSKRVIDKNVLLLGNTEWTIKRKKDRT
jgi:hypothetical protein